MRRLSLSIFRLFRLFRLFHYLESEFRSNAENNELSDKDENGVLIDIPNQEENDAFDLEDSNR